MDGDSWNLIILAICLVLSAYFSATETAFSSLNKIRMKNLADKGNKLAAKTLSLSEDFDSLLTTILIGNNVVNILGASIATVMFVGWVGNDRGPGISTIVTTVVVLIFGEVTPKSIAKEIPEKFAMFSYPLLSILVTVLKPFSWLFKQWKKLVSNIFKHSDEEVTITEEELITFVEETAQEGTIDEQESEMIRNVIELADLEAKDILKPRVDIVAVELNASYDEVEKIFSESGYSRLPVYENTVDRIVGVLYQKDFYNCKDGYNLEKLMKDPLYIIESKNIADLLRDLQAKKSHIAIVIDEYGSTVGLITLEDILEEIVGDIWDEHDEIVEEIQKVSDNEYIILGSTHVDEVIDALEITDIEETDVVTISGWLTSKINKVATIEDKITVDKWMFEITDMDGNRIEKIRATLV